MDEETQEIQQSFEKMILAKQIIIKDEPGEIVNNESELITLYDLDNTTEIKSFPKSIIFLFMKVYKNIFI